MEQIVIGACLNNIITNKSVNWHIGFCGLDKKRFFGRSGGRSCGDSKRCIYVHIWLVTEVKNVFTSVPKVWVQVSICLKKLRSQNVFFFLKYTKTVNLKDITYNCILNNQSP